MTVTPTITMAPEPEEEDAVRSSRSSNTVPGTIVPSIDPVVVNEVVEPDIIEIIPEIVEPTGPALTDAIQQLTANPVSLP